MSSIKVREWGEEGVLVELRGEFDQHNLEDLRETLNGVLALRRPTLMDLSGVTFLDIGTSRELVIRSRLYGHHLILHNLSWQVRASMAACGFETWVGFRSNADDLVCRRASEMGIRPYTGYSPTAAALRSRARE